MPKTKTRIGDIFEVFTPAGLAYVQYTHDGKGMGQLVRTLPGLFAIRPKNFAELAQQKELYFTFYTLEYAVRANDVELVSHQPVPLWARPYPTDALAGRARFSGRKDACPEVFQGFRQTYC
jgi:hypothetical protein